jgi:CDP-4-dehydro-6-deoxyglucose reductase
MEVTLGSEPVLSVSPTGQEILIRPGETILETLYRAGYAYRIGCRRGGCSICKVDLVEGEVTYPKVVAESVLSTEERAAGTCLTCRAVPTGSVTIALREESLRTTNPYLGMLARPAAG